MFDVGLFNTALFDAGPYPDGVVGDGTEPRAYADVVLLLEGSSTVDASQLATNLTAGSPAPGGYEAASARTAVTCPMHVVYRGVLDTTTDAGPLVAHGTDGGAWASWSLLLDSDNLIAVVNGSHVAALDSVVPAEPTLCTIVMALWPNPDTTGAGDAAICYLAAHVGDEYHFAPLATCVVPPTDGADTLHVAGEWDGVAWTPSVAVAPAAVRIGRAPRDMAHVAQDWIEGRPVPEVDEFDRADHLPVLTRASGIGSEGQYAGPVHAYSASQVRHVRTRCLGPVHQQVWLLGGNQHLDLSEWGAAATIVAGQMLPVGSYAAHLATAAWLPLHSRATRVRGRVYVRLTYLPGPTPTTPLMQIGVRLVCYAGLPGQQGSTAKVGSETHSAFTLEPGRSAIDGWLDLDDVAIARYSGPDATLAGTSTICLAIKPDINGDAETQEWSVAILALNTWAYASSSIDGPLDLPFTPPDPPPLGFTP